MSKFIAPVHCAVQFVRGGLNILLIFISAFLWQEEGWAESSFLRPLASLERPRSEKIQPFPNTPTSNAELTARNAVEKLINRRLSDDEWARLLETKSDNISRFLQSLKPRIKVGRGVDKAVLKFLDAMKVSTFRVDLPIDSRLIEFARRVFSKSSPHLYQTLNPATGISIRRVDMGRGTAETEEMSRRLISLGPFIKRDARYFGRDPIFGEVFQAFEGENLALEMESPNATVVSVGVANCSVVLYRAKKDKKIVIGEFHNIPTKKYICTLQRIVQDTSLTREERRDRYLDYWQKLVNPPTPEYRDPSLFEFGDDAYWQYVNFLSELINPARGISDIQMAFIWDERLDGFETPELTGMPRYSIANPVWDSNIPLDMRNSLPWDTRRRLFDTEGRYPPLSQRIAALQQIAVDKGINVVFSDIRSVRTDLTNRNADVFNTADEFAIIEDPIPERGIGHRIHRQRWDHIEEVAKSGMPVNPAKKFEIIKGVNTDI